MASWLSLQLGWLVAWQLSPSTIAVRGHLMHLVPVCPHFRGRLGRLGCLSWQLALGSVDEMRW